MKSLQDLAKMPVQTLHPRMKRIGVLTPSSNTVLEGMTQQIVAAAVDVSVHFSRFRVTEISLDPSATAQFDMQPVLDAAGLLADAEVDVIAWSGTSASWLGFDRDEALCESISRAHGIPAVTSVLAINELLEKFDAKRIALVSPYTFDVQSKIIENYRAHGVQVARHAHLNLRKNHSFGQVPVEKLEEMVRSVAHEVDAVVVMCTNLAAAPLATRLEAEFGIPLIDSVTAAAWAGARAVGSDYGAIRAWGRVFDV